MRLGNGRFESTVFNSRLQPTQIALGTSANNTSLLKLNYDYGTTDDNGNVKSQTITVSGMSYPLVQTYSYDSLNRLTSAEEKSNNVQQWIQSFTFDRYGNRRINTNATTSSLVGPNPQISESNNRITPQTGEQYLYDSAGNLTKDKDGNTFVYDGENKQITYNSGAGTTNGANYFYDGDGKRVKKIVGINSIVTIFVYDASGKLVAEYETNAPQTGGKIQYTTQDTLGSPRVLTNEKGEVTSRRDFLPFGEEITTLGGRTTANKYGQVDNVKQKFSGYEEDSETGLDFAQARYYSSLQGRFTSIDPIFMKVDRLLDPQRINLYAYVRNNPLVFIDPTGLDLTFELTTDEKSKKVTNLNDAKKYVALLEKATGLSLKLDEKTGKITIGKAIENLSKVAEKIKTIIEDNKSSVTIVVSNNDPNVNGGRFDGDGRQTLDLSDLDKLDNKDGGFTKESIALHETIEAYEGLSNGNDQEASHKIAVDYENEYRASIGLSPRVLGPQEAVSAVKGKFTFSVDFTTHIQLITVRMNSEGIPIMGDIIKSEVRKKKP
jgi:RHS repeat-associated protein